ncbi:hypothetical protein [Aphanothece hegewaldii]|nr:hypothetical protein [Aphanothece hegewaldii]
MSEVQRHDYCHSDLLSLVEEHLSEVLNEKTMEAGTIFESVLERSLYEADGTIKPHFRDFLRKQGYCETQIEQFQRQKKQEMETRMLFAQGNPVKLSPSQRAIARSGLEVEERLSQGYLAVEDLESKNSFDFEDLL